MPKNTSHAAFNDVVSRLNSKNLLDLWKTSSLFSCIEYFDTQENEVNFLMTTINIENVALFQQAVLASTSAEYKESQFTSKDVAYVLNLLNDASYRSGLLEGDEDADIRIRRLFSTMANSQVRLQKRDLLDRLGRTYAMFHAIPLRFGDELRELQKENFLDLPTVLPQHLGLSTGAFLSIGFALIELIRGKLEMIPVVNTMARDSLRKYISDSKSSDIANKKRSEALRKIVDYSKEWQQSLVFSPAELVAPTSSLLTLENVQAYLRLLAKTTREMREIVKQNPVYTEGQLPDRLSPLERYPIVALSNDQYIIPNLRYFDMALTELLHFILQENYPNNRFNQLKGYIQEIYLKSLVSERLPNVTIIPETTYRKLKKRLDGPDITIVDSENHNLVALESKSKRMRVTSRVNPTSPALIQDLARALDAFEKLPDKTGDLFAGILEYASSQSMIDTTKANTPILVVVVGEGVHFMPELLNDYLRQTPTHFLNAYPFPYALIHVEAFEDAVEIAASNQIPLYTLLHEYWIRSRISGIHDYSAESFGGRKADPSHRFLKQFTDTLFAEMMDSFSDYGQK